MAVIDNWMPPSRRDTVRVLAREIDDTIGGFARGQGALCLILSLFYAGALSLSGLNHGMLIGIAAGLMSFVPYLGSLGGLVVSICVSIAEFWPSWSHILIIPAVFFAGQTLADYVLSPYHRRPAGQLESCLDDVRVVRVRLSVRICRSVDCGAACGRSPASSCASR